MPICIAGMHRSGTSMIARMLNLCGLYLGEEDALHGAQADNPEGFWEHKRFQDLDDRILQLFGGAWDTPPQLPPNWLEDQRLRPLQEEAKCLVAEFEGYGNWGWKDPRNSLVLPFWQAIIPDLKVLVSLRNPLDVAASLTKRGYASQTFGVQLWKTYAEALEKDLGENTLWTHYSSYFADPATEIARVAAFCGLHPDADDLNAAVATVAGGLRHSETTVLDLLESEASIETVKLYFNECFKCGPVFEAHMRQEATQLAGVEREKAMRKKADRITQLEWLVNHRDSEIQALHVQNQNASNQLATTQAELQAMKESPTWRAAQRMQSNRALRGIARVALKLKTDGVGGTVKAGVNRIGTKSPTPELIQPEETPHVLDVLKLDAVLVAQEELEARVRKHSENRSFVLAISHDSFQAFTGGIQTLINDEMRTLAKEGVSQIHLCPLERIDQLSKDAEHLNLIVSVDGKALAVADAPSMVAVLQKLGAGECRSIQIHHTMNWNLSLIDKLLETVKATPKFFWLHDYYSVCRSYNLLRNDRAFCNAPPLNSNSCSICRYGPSRPGHMGSFKALFERWNFAFLTPSQKAADVWLKAYPEYASRLKITPIYHLEPTTSQNVREDSKDRKIRIAFPGIAYEFKGWSLWRKLVEALQTNPNYELLHLGQKVGELQRTAFPERFRRIRSGPSNPDALPKAFQEEKVDIIFYCPIWPETFSLIAYEAHAAGCWTLSTEDSGNVAAYITESKSGKVFPDIDSLIAYLSNVDRVREDLTNYKASTPFLQTLSYNEEIASQYAGGTPATV